MEQPRRLLNEHDPKFITSIEDCSIVLATRWRSDVLDTRSRGAVYIVDEWELEKHEWLA
jgi:hypothetical protein